MTAKDRLLASIIRVGAERLAERIEIVVKPLGVAAMATGDGIAFGEAFMDTADDELLDQLLVHEILHYAMGPNRAAIADLVPDLKLPKADRLAWDLAGESVLQESLPVPAFAGGESFDAAGWAKAMEARGMARPVIDYLIASTQAVKGFDPKTEYRIPSKEAFAKVDDILRKTKD